MVKEKGTHDELMNIKGIYHELVMRQTNKKETVSSASVKNVPSMDKKEELQEEEIEELSEKDIEKLDKVTEGEDVKNKQLTIEPTEVTVKKFDIRRLFILERKLLSLQKPELFWNIIGLISQALNGAIFPGKKNIFSKTNELVYLSL